MLLLLLVCLSQVTMHNFLLFIFVLRLPRFQCAFILKLTITVDSLSTNSFGCVLIFLHRFRLSFLLLLHACLLLEILHVGIYFHLLAFAREGAYSLFGTSLLRLDTCPRLPPTFTQLLGKFLLRSRLLLNNLACLQML